MKTFVYFIRPIGMDGPIKVGCSAKPPKRLLVLAAWSPFPLEIVGSVPGTFADEKFLHKHFSELHTRKEWFMSSPSLRHTMEKILGGTPIKEACKEIERQQAPKPIQRKQPPRTPDRELFLQYGRRIRKARDVLFSDRHLLWHEPEEIRAIMHNWRTDKGNGHVTVTPSPEQFAKLEEFISDPRKVSWSEPWKKRLRDPICIPIFGEAEAV